MTEPALPAAEAVRRLGGIARSRDVQKVSSKRRLLTALARGDLVRLNRGWVGVPARERAERAAASHGGVVSHTSAALVHGWAVITVPDLPRITVPPGTPAVAEPEEVAEVTEATLLPREIHGRLTSPLRTVFDCAHDLPFRDALAVADSALRSEVLTHDDLLHAAARCAAGCRCRRVAEYADGRAANPFESALRALCIEIRLCVVPQWEVEADGMTLHPDLANPMLGLAVEADSYTHHGMEKADFARDLVRYNALAVTGWLVLRFTYEQVMSKPDYVRKLLRAAVAHQMAALGDPIQTSGGSDTLRWQRVEAS